MLDMRRRNQINIFPFILLIFIAPSLISSLIGGLFWAIEAILPFAMIIFIGVMISMTVAGSKQNRSSRSSTSRNNKGKSSVREKSRFSNREMAMIDRKLKDYFENNASLLIADDIALTTGKGLYTSVDDLYLTYRDERVVKLSEYKLSYREVYNQIADLLLEFAKEVPVKEKVSKKKETESSEEVKQPKKEEPKLSTAVEYINRIDTLNKAIPNEEITNGLYQTCDLLKQIDLSNSEKKSEKLKKLYDYYLPILVNILEKYHQLDSSPIKGEELETCKTQLIKTILLINQALKTIYSSLHEEDYMNLNADITTLQSLLKKDGLVDNPFGGDDNE